MTNENEAASPAPSASVCSDADQERLHPEWDLIRKTLKEFGYCETASGWFPRHCFSDTLIEFRGFEWSITIDGSKSDGRGYFDLMQEMVRRKAQPFSDKWMDRKSEN